MNIKKLSILLFASLLFVPMANADFLGIGGWTKKHIVDPVEKHIVKPIVHETNKQIDSLENTKAYKDTDRLLVRTTRTVKNHCDKSLTLAFTPLVGAVCGKTTSAALGAACAATIGEMGTLFVMPAGIASVALCVPLVGYTSQIGCNGPLIKGAGILNTAAGGPIAKIDAYSKYKKVINRFKTEQAHELAKLTCGL